MSAPHVDARTAEDALGGASRLAWVDYAKAFAIGLVVFGHASRSVERTGGLTWSDGLQLADRLIYSFHIPLFFILAGFTATLVAGRGLGSQLRGLWWGVAVPYVVWSVVWVALKMAFPGAVNEPVQWTDLLTALWLPVEHMWFLQHLLIARLFWLLVDRSGLVAGVSAQSVLILALFGLALLVATVESEPRHVTAIVTNMGFVGVGTVWVPLLLQRASAGWVPVVFLIAIGLWLRVALQPGANELGLTSDIAALLGSMVVILVAWRMWPPQGRIARAVAFVGEASLAIYVIHSIVIAALRVVLQKAGLLDETMLITLGTALGLAVPAVLCWTMLELSARTGQPLTRWAGLGTGTRSHYIATTRASDVQQSAAAPAQPLKF